MKQHIYESILTFMIFLQKFVAQYPIELHE